MTSLVPIGLLTAALALSPAAAAARQMDAADKPTVSGPLSTTDQLQVCKKRTQRRDGEVVARFKVCNGYYVFDPERESDAARDYAAYWIQANVNAARGWCATKARIILPLPGSGVHRKAPRPGTLVRADKGRPYTTRLRVDADGHANNIAVIKNTFRLRPGTLTAAVKKEPRRYRLRWTGRSHRRLGFAAGIEISWPAEELAPAIVPRVEAVFKQAAC